MMQVSLGVARLPGLKYQMMTHILQVQILSHYTEHSDSFPYFLCCEESTLWRSYSPEPSIQPMYVYKTKTTHNVRTWQPGYLFHFFNFMQNSFNNYISNKLYIFPKTFGNIRFLKVLSLNKLLNLHKIKPFSPHIVDLKLITNYYCSFCSTNTRTSKCTMQPYLGKQQWKW